MNSRETKRSQDAGAPEIAVTPEMIEAGAKVIWNYFFDVTMYGSGIGREAAAEVYRAMRHLEKSSANASPLQSRQASPGGRDTT
jgi:hypothetical protein